MKRYLLVDGNSIAHAANAGTKLTVGDQEVQAIYGVMRTMRKLLSVYGLFTPIVLWDGASWRKMAYPDYKENRKKDDTAHQRALLDAKASIKKQTPAIRKGLTLCGVSQMFAANMEADDLAGILVERFEQQETQTVLVSADRDWIQLVGSKVSWFDPINDRKINATTLAEKYGVTDAAQYLEMKAIMGDAGDNLPGVGGVGEKGAVEFLQKYGSWANFSNQVMDGTIDVKKLPKKYRALVEDESKQVQFSLNLKLMDLRTKKRPEPINMKLTPGEPDIERLRAFFETLMFRSMLKDLDTWVSVFPGHKERIAA